MLIEPDSAGRRLAHLGARRSRQQRARQRQELLLQAHAAAEIDSGDDVAPLVGAAHLQIAAVAARKLDIVVGLQQHVVELDEREFLFPIETKLGAVHRQHAIDGEMAADVAQKFDVVERCQPFGVIDHQCISAAVPECQELRKHLFHAVLVVLDLLDRAQLPRFIFARWIANPGRAAAHQCNRLAAALLKPVQHHDRQQRTDVQRRRGAIVADVGHHAVVRRQLVESFKIRALVHVAALGHNLHEVGFQCRHCYSRLSSG